MATPWKDFAPLLWEGLKATVEVSLYAAAATLVIALIFGLCLVSRFKIVRVAAHVYVEIFRGLPLLVLLIWVYFALPFIGIVIPKVIAAVLAIGLNYGAFGAVIVRSSIQAIPVGQREAAIALNFTPIQRMMHVIMPQALLRMLPPLGNLLIELLKSTSLIYFITLSDLTYQAMILRNNYSPLTPQIFGLLLIIYFLLAMVISTGTRWLERKLSVGRV